MQQVTVASAQYPITEHPDFASWQHHTEKWVADAAIRGAELLLFPEYGAMELVSIFNDEIRNDIRRQIHALNDLKTDFCATFDALARKYRSPQKSPTMADWSRSSAILLTAAKAKKPCSIMPKTSWTRAILKKPGRYC